MVDVRGARDDRRRALDFEDTFVLSNPSSRVLLGETCEDWRPSCESELKVTIEENTGMVNRRGHDTIKRLEYLCVSKYGLGKISWHLLLP